MSLRDKIRELDLQVRFGFLSRIFPTYEDSCIYFAMIQEIPQQARQQLRSKAKSSGLEVEANLHFLYKNVYSQCSSINKQGIFLQVNH